MYLTRNLNLTSNLNYIPSLGVLLRFGVVTKGRGPLIPLVRSTGGVLASKTARVIGWNLANPGGGETGGLGMNGTEGTVGVRGEVYWRLRESLRLGTGGISSLESNCRPC